MAGENSVRSILCNQLSAGEHTMREDGEAIPIIFIATRFLLLAKKFNLANRSPRE